MKKKRISSKYKDMLHLAMIIVILFFYAYYENNRKQQLVGQPQKNIFPVNNTPVISHN